MIQDNNLLFAGTYANGAWTGQTLAQVAGTYNAVNVLDVASLAAGAAPNQLESFAQGRPLDISISIVQTVAGPGASVQFQLVQADDAAISTNVEVLVQTAAFPIATLNTQRVFPMSLGGPWPRTPRRFLGVRFIVSGATITTGAFAAGITVDTSDLSPLSTIYKQGIQVL